MFLITYQVYFISGPSWKFSKFLEYSFVVSSTLTCVHHYYIIEATGPFN